MRTPWLIAYGITQPPLVITKTKISRILGMGPTPPEELQAFYAWTALNAGKLKTAPIAGYRELPSACNYNRLPLHRFSLQLRSTN